jgi:hypothetical protein
MKENRRRLGGYRVEYAVGTILWWNEREIEVVRDRWTPVQSGCDDCVLRYSRTCRIAVKCSSETRKDGENVHFENVRKEERI